MTLSCGDANPIALPFNVIEIKRYPRKAAHQRIAFFVELVDGEREKPNKLGGEPSKPI